jgi:hypothetical protein
MSASCLRQAGGLLYERKLGERHPLFLISPFSGKIQTGINRPRCGKIGIMTCDYHLTVGYLAKLGAILSCHTHGMLPLLGNSSIIVYQDTISQRHIVTHTLNIFLVDSLLIPYYASQTSGLSETEEIEVSASLRVYDS